MSEKTSQDSAGVTRSGGDVWTQQEEAIIYKRKQKNTECNMIKVRRVVRIKRLLKQRVEQEDSTAFKKRSGTGTVRTAVEEKKFLCTQQQKRNGLRRNFILKNSFNVIFRNG